MITQCELKKLLSYSPETGTFTRNISTNPNPRSRAGYIHNCVETYGYIVIKINGRSYLGHRLAWLYVYGYFPENTIDHINRIRTDNRINNLREVSFQCQCRNRGNRTNNKSGIKGVYWDKRDKKWTVQITTNYKRYIVGYFNEKLEAVYHRFAAEQCLGFLDCDKNSSALKFIKQNELSGELI